MLIQQKLFSVLISCLIIGTIIYLVKKGKLKEEYSWLWLLTGIIILTLALWYDLLLFVTRLIGAVLPVSTIFFFGVFFLILISLYFSVKLSTLSKQMKTLTQKLAILSEKVERNSPNQKS